MQPDTLWVLVHSPLVGPCTWSFVAQALQARGWDAVVPTLADSDVDAQPYWQQHAAAVAQALAAVPSDRPVALVGHSGAGPLLPAIRAALPHVVAAYLFVDAGLPRRQASRLDLLGSESPARAQELRQVLAAGRRFPNWGDEQLRELVPDPQRRQQLLAELRPRDLRFFSEPLPVSERWPDAPCAYLQLSSTYAGYARAAHQQGWPLRQLDAGHFHMLVAPEAVAQLMVELVTVLRPIQPC